MYTHKSICTYIYIYIYIVLLLFAKLTPANTPSGNTGSLRKYV